MGARLSRLSASFVPARLKPCATASIALPTPDHIKPSQPSPSLDAAEAQLISQLTAASYVKRLIRLPSGVSLNTISAGPTSAPTLVILPGWGAGTAFFARSLPTLSVHFRVHLVDWPGFGASSRPPFDSSWTPEQAETFFINALSEWAAIMPTHEPHFQQPFHIVAHSLGAYLATAFALKFPRLVRSLVLASPVGVPRAPENPVPPRRSMLTRLLFRLVFAAWDMGFTPQMLIRALPYSWGRHVAGRIVLPRFVIDSPDVNHALVDYFYEISAGARSAELSLCTILQSGAYARRPLCDRMHDLKMPVTFMYGDRDWMSSSAAQEVCETLSVPWEIVTVPHAGHHVYFDNVEFFDDVVIRSCLDKTARPDMMGQRKQSEAEIEQV